jgi:hypothetical protein
MHKLDDKAAQNCGAQLLEALTMLQARHGWSDGDLVAVSSLAITEMIVRAVGPTRAAEFFRGHGDALAAEHARRSVA